MIKTRIIQVNPLAENTAVLWREGSGACVIVDPGMCSGEEYREVAGLLAENGLRPEAILLTHGHFDHILGVGWLLEQYSVPVYLHPADRATARLGVRINPVLHGNDDLSPDAELERWLSLTRDVTEAEPVVAAGLTFRVLETPGHSPGGVCYYLEEGSLLLSGDTLFAGCIGRSDLAGGDYDALIHSILDKLMPLGDEIDVLPGHGDPTTLGREALYNPFLLPFNDPDPSWDQDPSDDPDSL